MSYNPEIHKRKSIRLKEYDYSQAGLYFMTICVHERSSLFGKIENGDMILNDAGKMVNDEWIKLPKRFINIELHEFIIMPNHFHGILEIVGATLVVAPLVVAQCVGQPRIGQPPQKIGQPQGIAPTVASTGNNKMAHKTVGDMMAAFKSITTVEYIRGVKTLGWQAFNGKLWQRNYYEHIIRNQQSHETISHYILNNPAKWQDDKLYNQ